MTLTLDQKAVLQDDKARELHQHLLDSETGCSLGEAAEYYGEDLVALNLRLSALVGAGLARNERRGNVMVYVGVAAG
ncbi:MAG TPA: hypothetical protein VFK14_00290 [Solirubrobacterales bacterium]|nr:hypothetical protein [Solirubrobacterales bacterium]